MAFVAKYAKDYEVELLGLIHALTGGADITEGSPDAVLASAISLMMQTFDARLRSLVAARGLLATGRDADEVVAQIMSGTLRRRGASAARGPAMAYTREDTSGTLVVPAGVVFRSIVDPSLEYRSLETVTFADGQSVYPSPSQTPVTIVALQPGTRSNAAVGSIRVVVQGTGAPNQLTSVTNVEAIVGEDEETTESLLQRASLLISGIAKAQPAALRSLAQQEIAADRTVIRDAVVFEPPDIPGYVELVISDGFGLQGYTRDATWQTGTVGAVGATTLYFDGPAATEPLLVINPDPLDPVGAGATPAGNFPGAVVIHERGVLEFIGAPLPPGTTWAIGGHKVHTGPVADIQRLIEGNYSRGTSTDYGWRAAGTRVRARPPIVDVIGFRFRAVFRSGVDVIAGRNTIVQITRGYLASVGIGGTLNLFRLTDLVGDYEDVEDFEILQPVENIVASSRRHQFATFGNLVTFV